MSELLKITGLYGGYKEGVDILQGIDLTIQEGQSIGIIGLNGSGKSTLGKAIMNMIPIRKGKIEFNGKDVTDLTTHELARKGISIMQQGGQVFQTMSVWENMELAFGPDSNCEIERIKDIIPLLQRSKKELQRQMADKLSGGQKHQLALAMALASNPRLVILDEPSAGLSPKAVEDMYSILRAVREQMRVTIVLIEQNIAKAVEFCDKSNILQQGIIIQSVLKSEFNDVEKVMFK